MTHIYRLVLVALALSSAACASKAEPPFQISPAPAPLQVTPESDLRWQHTDPCFEAKGGTGQYEWALEAGYGLLDPMKANTKRICLRSGSGRFRLRVRSGGQTVVRVGIIG